MTYIVTSSVNFFKWKRLQKQETICAGVRHIQNVSTAISYRPEKNDKIIILLGGDHEAYRMLLYRQAKK